MSDTRTKNSEVPNSLQTYLREIKDESLLTAAEECTLAEAIARGDLDARTRMIQANLRLVVKIALDYVGRGMVLEDLIGEGNLGLIRAAEEFEPRFGTRFSTYASYWIKQSIRHALINTTSTIRLPAHMVGLLTKWRRAERTLYREWGRVPSFDELCLVSRTERDPEVLGGQGASSPSSQAGERHWRGSWASVSRGVREPLRTGRVDDGSRGRPANVAAPPGTPRPARANGPGTPLWPGGRAPFDSQGNRPPIGRDPRMGAQDRASRSQ